MQYLRDLKKIERNENYTHLVGDLRRRVYQRLGDLLNGPKTPTRQEVKDLLYEELEEGRVTPELEWYTEGFARGLFKDGSAYYRTDLGPEKQSKANRHNHLGYSAGMHLRRIRDLEGKVTRVQ